jgi:sterol desaturase/sphingolipid hydroxylase (fatty acid hydroxylase superfamily)
MSFLTLLGPVKALLIAAAVFVPFERVAAANRSQRICRRGWATDLLTGVANGLVLYALLLVVLGGVDALAAGVAPHVRAWAHAQPLWAQSLVAIAIGDLGIYAVHRLQHTVPWLWKFHAVHHSAEEMDWLVAFRFHPLDLFLSRVASIAPLIALDLTPAAVGIFIAVFGWQSWLVHANVRVPYGPLRWALVSPEFHHWHHAAEREAYDTNFASLLACWDVLFGTARLPRDREPQQYGVSESVPAGYVKRFYYPFRRAAAASQTAAIGRARLSAPPGRADRAALHRL